jgi:hypothetical protein
MDEPLPQPQGNPQTPPQAPPQQQQYAPYVRPYEAQRMPSPFESMVRSSTFLTMIFLGMLFLFLGMLMFSILPEIASDTTKHVKVVGYIFVSLSMFILSTFLMLAAVVRKEMEKHMRVMLMIAALLLIYIWPVFLHMG